MHAWHNDKKSEQRAKTRGRTRRESADGSNSSDPRNFEAPAYVPPTVPTELSRTRVASRPRGPRLRPFPALSRSSPFCPRRRTSIRVHRCRRSVQPILASSPITKDVFRRTNPSHRKLRVFKAHLNALSSCFTLAAGYSLGRMHRCCCWRTALVSLTACAHGERMHVVYSCKYCRRPSR